MLTAIKNFFLRNLMFFCVFFLCGPRMVSFLYSITQLGYIMTLLLVCLNNQFSSATTTNTSIFFNGLTMRGLRPEIFQNHYYKIVHFVGIVGSTSLYPVCSYLFTNHPTYLQHRSEECLVHHTCSWSLQCKEHCSCLLLWLVAMHPQGQSQNINNQYLLKAL